MFKYIFVAIFCIALHGQVQNPGFEQPSSLVYYPGAKTFIVSNLKGAENVRNSYANLILISNPFERPAKNKFKILHSNSGKQKDIQAPVKLILDGDTLIVGDSRQVALFDVDGYTLKPKKLILLKQIMHLKSMALTDDGDLYLSDHQNSRIYKITDLYSADHKVEAVTNKIPSPAGLLYEDGFLYIVSTSHNMIYVYNCLKSEPEKKIRLTENVSSPGVGFVDICRGSEGEFYLLHKDRESVYLFNEEWAGKRSVKLFKNGLIAPRSITYHPNQNALLVTQDFANSIALIPALKMRPALGK